MATIKSKDKVQLDKFFNANGLGSMPVDQAAREVAKSGSDEVVMWMIEEYPETLEMEDVASRIASRIAEYRGDKVDYKSGGDKVAMKMMEEHPKTLEMEDVASNIAEYRGDEVVMWMIKEHPKTLKMRGVAHIIAMHTAGDEVVMWMMKEHPETLKMENVARCIAGFGSDEVAKWMIEKHPETLKMGSVASSIVWSKGDEVVMWMINEHPETMRMEGVINALVRRNNAKAAARYLAAEFKIRPKDEGFVASELSAILGAMGDDDQLKLQAFGQILDLARECAGSNKSVDGYIPYRALAGIVGLDKSKVELLIGELSLLDGDVKRSLPLRGIAYAMQRKNGAALLHEFVGSTGIIGALSMFPLVCELRDENIIDNQEFGNIASSKDKEAALSAQLSKKSESVFGVAPASRESVLAMSNHQFLIDLFGLRSKYHGYKDQSAAETVLLNVVKNYFESGIIGFKEFKFKGHELASEQLSDAYSIRGKLMDLDRLSVTHTKRGAMPYDIVENDLKNYSDHKKALLKVLGIIEEDAIAALAATSKSAKSKDLSTLLNSRDLAGLTAAAFDSEDEKVKARGIAQIKALGARDSIGFIDDIFKEVQRISMRTKPEQEAAIAVIANRVGAWIDNDKGMEPVKVLKGYLSKGKKQAPNGADQADIAISSNALDNAISAMAALRDYGKSAGGTTITAQVTFDPEKLLTFGRYGSSGSGNCQSSKGSPQYNQSLMSMVGDANQFMIMFRKADDANPLGFMQMHLLKSKERGMIFLMENPYTNEPDKTTAMKEAAKTLAQKIKNETGLDCFSYGEIGDEIEVEVPRSYVSRYIDFTRSLMGTDKFVGKLRTVNMTAEWELRR